MLTLRVDKWLRVGAGCGVLLLLVAHQKLCPWLVDPPTSIEAESAKTKPHHRFDFLPVRLADPLPDDEEPAKHTLPWLPYLLPDSAAVTPRWPVSWNVVALRPAAGWRDGIVSCGGLRPGVRGLSAQTPIDAADLAWHVFLTPAEPAGFSTSQHITCLTLVHPAVGSSIVRTGPPRV
jgi:hypothetical protein